MNKKITIKTSLLAAGLILGLAAPGVAQTTGGSSSAPAADLGKGLLGQSYASFGFSYTDAHKKPFDLQGLDFQYNQPLNTGFDFNLALADEWSTRFAGTRNHEESAFANAIAFMPDLSWGRPFVGVGAGWIWEKHANVKDDSIAGDLTAGVEFQVTKELSLTPFGTYVATTSSQINLDNRWVYGVKANYWITRQWALNAQVSRDNQVDTTCSIGTTWRF
jgi:hypothetical protein